MEKANQLYEGKAKKVFATDDAEMCIVEYKDDATAFNGLKKGTITGKGVVNNRMSNFMFKLLEEKGFPIETIDNILLVGGSSCIPLVKKMLSDRYGAEKVLSSEKPMLAIAEGAAILAHSLPAEEEIPTELIMSPEHDAECLVVHTTKKATFLEIEDGSGNKSYEKIIDSGEVLPHEKNKEFFTLADNQKIVGVKLFSQKEDGSYESTSTGYFTISENLPKSSRLLFTFNIDLDEIVSIKVKVDATGKSQEVILARGKIDSGCLDALTKAITDVNNNPDISSEDRVSFMKKVQGLIDRINTKKRDEMDPEWKSIESDLKSRNSLFLNGHSASAV